MNRARYVAAALVGVSLVGGPAIAQQSPPQAPPMTSVLAGKKFTPPIKGLAEVGFTTPVSKREKDMVVTRMNVTNLSASPIPRLTVDVSWYDKAGGLVTGGKGVINGLLQPGEIKLLEIMTPYDAKMASNNYNFSHANGTVKPKNMKTLVVPKEPATKPAAATKAPATKR